MFAQYPRIPKEIEQNTEDPRIPKEIEQNYTEIEILLDMDNKLNNG